MSVDDIGDDTLRPLDGAIASIDLVRVLLWIVAAVIIGSVVYLSALERQRDFAVLKAIGTSNRTLLASLALQAVLVALAAVALAAVIQIFLAPAFPLKVRVPARAFWQLPLLAVIVALIAGACRDASGGSGRSGRGVRWSRLMSELRVRDLVVEFVHDGYAVRPLDGLSFDAPAGELVVLLGPSGCGKTTLLSCIGGILTPTSGTIQLGDLDVTALSRGQTRGVPARPRGLRVPGLQPDPVAVGTGEHRPADGAHRARSEGVLRTCRRTAGDRSA